MTVLAGETKDEAIERISKELTEELEGLTPDMQAALLIVCMLFGADFSDEALNGEPIDALRTLVTTDPLMIGLAAGYLSAYIKENTPQF